MRIIAGKFRGRKLKSPPSLATRPTSDRLRETLFNVLAPRIGGARFLDLCAGTGAVGIEALSRGAAHATFVDQSRTMSALIEVNCESLRLQTHEFEIFTADAFDFFRRRVKKSSSPFDVIFFDPPYASDYDPILKFIGENGAGLMTKAGILIVEHDKRRELAEVIAALHKYRIRKQGDSCLSFYELAAQPECRTL